MERLEREQRHFKELFLKRLQDIEPFSKEDGENEAYSLRPLGISTIRLQAPVVIFALAKSPEYLDDGPYQLWIEDIKRVSDKSYPHYELEAQLESYLDDNKILKSNPRPSRGSAYVIESDQGQLYLTVSSIIASSLSCRLQCEVEQYVEGQKQFAKFVPLIGEYGLTNIIGTFSLDIKDGNLTLFTSYQKFLLEADLIGKIRENNYIYSFAEKYQMTYFQFLRFRSLVLACKESSTAIVYDKSAQEIAKES